MTDSGKLYYDVLGGMCRGNCDDVKITNNDCK